MQKLLNIVNVSNLKKTWNYLKKNGLLSAYYAARERMEGTGQVDYAYQPPDEETLMRQRRVSGERMREDAKQMLRYSIVVPAYETKETHLIEMIESVLRQSYPYFQLIVADAGTTDTVARIAQHYDDERVRYVRLTDNLGIAGNTNAALQYADGDYVGLLDHDDLLTPDALYEMDEAVRKGGDAWSRPELLYSDEDKGDGECLHFYDPHFKPDFNPDLLLSNNYICHFLVMKTSLMKELLFRSAFDGAQDYDLVLRAAGTLYFDKAAERVREDDAAAIVHVPKVLYHWRCHGGSTAENPSSKKYAYDAGRRALDAFISDRGWSGRTEETRHLGFYNIVYQPDLFHSRQSVGIVGGRLIDHNGSVRSGLIGEDGAPCYYGVHKEYSGYMHRASLQQTAYAVDIRCMKVREELWPFFERQTGMPYREDEAGFFDWKGLQIDTQNGEAEEEAYLSASLHVCREAAGMGYAIVWQPKLCTQLKKRDSEQ